MYLIYVFILFELCLLFLNSCIYSIHVWIHVFIIFEYMYLLFLTIKLFFMFLFIIISRHDMSFAISILWLNDIHI